MLTKTNPFTDEAKAKENAKIADAVAKLTIEELMRIKNEFILSNFHNSTETFLYLPTFKIINNLKNKNLVKKLVENGLGDYNKLSGCSIHYAKNQIERAISEM